MLPPPLLELFERNTCAPPKATFAILRIDGILEANSFNAADAFAGSSNSSLCRMFVTFRYNIYSCATALNDDQL